MFIAKIFVLIEDVSVALNIMRDLSQYHNVVFLCLEKNKKKTELLRHSLLKSKIKYIADYSKYFNQLDDENKINLIFPTHDFEIFEILNNTSIQGKCLILAIDKLKAILDKEKLYNILKDCRIPLLQIFYQIPDIVYPIVVKEKKRENTIFWKKFNSKYLLINNKKILNEVISKYGKQSNLIFQEYLPKIPNNEYSYIGYSYKNGEITGKVVRKTHQIKQGGVTTFAEYSNSEKIENYSKKILKKINYKGIFEIEFLYSNIKDDYFFIDFNARCCHWYNLLSGSGINLPLIFVNDMRDSPHYPENFNDKNRYIDLKAEIMHHIVYGNNISVLIKRIIWLIKTISAGNIVFAIYNKCDRQCNEYLIKDIIKSIYRYYYYSFYKKHLKVVARKLGIYNILKI